MLKDLFKKKNAPAVDTTREPKRRRMKQLTAWQKLIAYCRFALMKLGRKKPTAQLPAARHSAKRRLVVKPRFIAICGSVAAVLVLVLVLTGTFAADGKTVTAQGSVVSAEPSASAEPTDSAAAPEEPDAQDTGAADTQEPDAPEKPDTPDPGDTTTTASDATLNLKQGMTSPEVAKMQQRLMDLNYMDDDMPTDLFGPMTEKALELFQRKHELKMDGIYTEDVKKLLFSDQAKKYTVTIGVSGVDVQDIQSRLRELDYISKVTNYFGEDTEAAVKKFQENNGLDPDGSVGEQTKEVLFSDKAKAFYYAQGTSGDDVLKLQQRLAALGYLTTVPDGKYGADTVNAVKRFQDQSGFIADGYVGPDTKALLFSGKAEPNALGIGDNGSDVVNVQKRLIALKYLKDDADGYFGSNTEGAVKLFQKTNKLGADGKVGAVTLKTLLSDGAKKAPSGSTGGGGGGGGTINPQTKSVDNLIKIARSKMGSRYVRGAKGPNTFDCSGFVYWCLNKAGVKQGYMTSGGWAVTTKYKRISKMSDLKKGDIISFKGHVGIALGGGLMIDCAPSGNGVRIGHLSQSYWKRNFIRGYRIF